MTYTEIRGRMTLHHCDDCLDQSKFYECVGKRVFVHCAFSWLSGTVIVDVKGQICLCVLDNRIISVDKMAPGKNISNLGKKYRGNFKGSTENAVF